MDTVMELEIGPGPEPGSYVVRVLRSVGGGEPTETVRLDLDDLVDRRPHLEASVLSSSVTARRVMSDTEAAIQDVGRRLFDSAFAGSVAGAYRTSMAVASERGKSVQIALRLTAPGLAALPWETLYDAQTQTYLCRKEPLVRNVPAPYSPAALAVSPPLRVLAMISSPRGLPALDIDDERERLASALKPHLDAGRVELHWLEDASWDGIHAKLLEREWHVLHFIGHGAYDTDTDEGVLAFVGRDGRADYVAASALADLLDEADPTPRLVVLNSCQSGAAGTSDLFSGTAAALAHSGIRAVAAMQFSISDVAAIAFARGFYTALAYGRGIDEAVRSGRIGILGIGRGTLEWVTPVLYLRGEDAHLFDVAPLPAAPPPQKRPEPVTTSGRMSGAMPALVEETAHPRPTVGAPPAAASAPTGSTGSSDVAREAPVPPRPPADVPPPPAAPPSSGPPTSPPGPPSGSPPTAPTPRHPSKRPSRAKPWITVALIAAVAIGGAIATFLLLRPDTDGGGGDASTAELALPMDTAWTDVGLYCEQGDEFVITVTGTAYHDGTAESEVGPDGLTNGEGAQYRVLADANTASVIGRLDTIPEMFPVGSGTTYVCPAQGGLELGINDTGLVGNSGEFHVSVVKNS
ncbi:CHAT domain-containing protein [Agromyces sp. NPDC057865]|uniref:CHAT domain-containing protein n=1 Tax=Agromyces sp. NPDC057865 TaxID=3346267 RepID=UPI00366C8673